MPDRRTTDPLFLAVTRSACVYGIPYAGRLPGFVMPMPVFLLGFLPWLVASGILHDGEDLGWRLVAVGGSLFMLLTAMRMLPFRKSRWPIIAIVMFGLTCLINVALLVDDVMGALAG
jgi:hypothetical protein